MQNLNFSFRNKNISINTLNQMLQVNGNSYSMTATYNTDIINAEKDNTVYLSSYNASKNVEHMPIYLCARNIMERKVVNDFVYMDFLIYNNDDVFDGLCVNRSKGHVNDIGEVEVFQILKGKIFSLFMNQQSEKYFGVFDEGEYYHVPRGWFHCTYT